MKYLKAIRTLHKYIDNKIESESNFKVKVLSIVGDVGKHVIRLEKRIEKLENKK